ncbi:hypothetical protein E2C01_060441 [Portunus trituberculatus]|uniref:Uncharacterized protein n=1 Tax=Portunus trituberculatus TaxID=210409 RepID=A0A5B7HC30_PORTR|nr:hypothetical protein [Portunus trituberculatus]
MAVAVQGRAIRFPCLPRGQEVIALLSPGETGEAGEADRLRGRVIQQSPVVGVIVLFSVGIVTTLSGTISELPELRREVHDAE